MAPDLAAIEVEEDDGFVDAVEEFRPELGSQGLGDPALHLLAPVDTQLLDDVATHVGGHDHDAVFEINGLAVTVGHAAVRPESAAAR